MICKGLNSISSSCLTKMLVYFFFAETTSNANENLPPEINTTVDPSLNNLTRNDINCDKTGTCYDGKF
jgi:hypothetical protein